ncbi:hypothetical protein [Roseomonas sp. BN140053]|uniref:hypothetical protein n=1 Tax=Roseomonas sp. BN140053 TaxID=3391898 RepID=UPI0039E7A6EE
MAETTTSTPRGGALAAAYSRELLLASTAMRASAAAQTALADALDAMLAPAADPAPLPAPQDPAPTPVPEPAPVPETVPPPVEPAPVPIPVPDPTPISPPAPTPAGSDLTTIRLSNVGAGPLPAGIASFATVFAPGEVPAGHGLAARLNGTAAQAQIDVQNTHADGSARFARVAVSRPELAPGASVEVALAAVPAQEGAAITASLPEVAVEVTRGGRTERVVLSALAATGYPRRGALARSARHTALLDGSMRLVADLSSYRGGDGFGLDLQVNNDRAMELTGGSNVTYDLRVLIDGAELFKAAGIAHAQYQNKLLRFPAPHDGGQGLRAPEGGVLHIRHDVARLARLGAVFPFDVSLTVPEKALAAYAVAMAAPDWGAYWGKRGIAPYMPTTGGRADIGLVTAHVARWVISQDPRAAAYALGQAEAGFSIPWFYWDERNGTWLNTDNYPQITANGRQAMVKKVDRLAAGLTQHADYAATGWNPDAAHQPDLFAVPYLLTGEPWLLDALNAQASWNIATGWNQARKNEQALMFIKPQVRSASWGIRTLEQARYLSADGSPEQRWAQGVVERNWRNILDQMPAWMARHGEIGGFVDPEDYTAYSGGVATWQQNYLIPVVALAAQRGSADARSVLEQLGDWLVRSYRDDVPGYNWRDGAAMNWLVAEWLPAQKAEGTQPALPARQGKLFTTYAEVGAAMEITKRSNGAGWSKGEPQGGLASLASVILTLGPDAALSRRARATYERIVAAGPADSTRAKVGENPAFAVMLPGGYVGG